MFQWQHTLFCHANRSNFLVHHREAPLHLYLPKHLLIGYLEVWELRDQVQKRSLQLQVEVLRLLITFLPWQQTERIF